MGEFNTGIPQEAVETKQTYELKAKLAGQFKNPEAAIQNAEALLPLLESGI
jgi:hypothetical protein